MGLGTTPLIIFQFIIAAIDASGCERVIIGVWTSTKTASRREPILSSWWRNGCVKWLAAEGSDVPGDAVDVVAAGGRRADDVRGVGLEDQLHGLLLAIGWR